MKRLSVVCSAILFSVLLALPGFADAAPIPDIRPGGISVLMLIGVAAVVITALVLLIAAIRRRK